jgi:hypothetical protein
VGRLQHIAELDEAVSAALTADNPRVANAAGGARALKRLRAIAIPAGVVEGNQPSIMSLTQLVVRYRLVQTLS